MRLSLQQDRLADTMTRNHVCSFAIAAAFAATPVFAQLPPLPPAPPAAPALPGLPAEPASPGLAVIGRDARPPQPPAPPRGPFLIEPLQIRVPEIAIDTVHLEPFTLEVEPAQFDALNFAWIDRDVPAFEWGGRTELGWNDALGPAVPLPPCRHRHRASRSSSPALGTPCMTRRAA
jgi:hypothetical protein